MCRSSPPYHPPRSLKLIQLLIHQLSSELSEKTHTRALSVANLSRKRTLAHRLSGREAGLQG